MKIALKNLDSRNVGSVITWTRKNGDSTTAEILGFTHHRDDDRTTVHTPLGDHKMFDNTMVDIQLPKSAMLLAQMFSELERQGMPGEL